jgi:DNA-binding NtrC family response regulator
MPVSPVSSGVPVPAVSSAPVGPPPRELDRSLTGFTDRALERLLDHTWPGNVRELENAVQRAAILTSAEGGLVSAEDIELRAGESEPRRETFQEAKRRVITEFERRWIDRVLIASRGNVSRAARSSGKDRRSFWSLIQKHSIDVERYR